MNGAEMTRKERIQWWRDGKYGMFIHWGLYALPCGVWKERVFETGYSEWLMFEEKIPVQDYAALAKQFNPSRFDAAAWVDVAKQAGMRYLVLTTKHHDGFSMFDSDITSYSITKATPWKRDPTQELADACRAAGMRFGCYYSTDRDWYRAQGPGNRYKQTNVWDYPESTHDDFDAYFQEIVKPQVTELLVKYQADLLWFDEIDLKSPAQVEELHDMIRAINPDCIINSRIKGCTFPDVIPPPHCDYISSGDNEILDRNIDFEWENPASMNTSYGYNVNDNNWVSPRQVVAQLADIVSKGGNLLLNVGPTADGIIPQPSVDNLVEAGRWLAINGEAITGTSTWPVASDEEGTTPGLNIRFTRRDDCLYAICLEWTAAEVCIKALAEAATDDQIAGVAVVGSGESISWSRDTTGLHLSVPTEIPCDYALVYRIELA